MLNEDSSSVFIRSLIHSLTLSLIQSVSEAVTQLVGRSFVRFALWVIESVSQVVVGVVGVVGLALASSARSKDESES